MSKACSACRQTKPLDAFHRAKSGKYGRHARCKSCRAVSGKTWRAGRAEYRRDYQREYRRANPDLMRAQSARRTSEYHRVANLKAKYGITPEAFEALSREQNDECACCGTKLALEKRGGFVDHCHSTKRVRGILCIRCNSGIGMLGDSIEGLLRAVSYLSRAVS